MTDIDVACAASGDGWTCAARVTDDRGTTAHEVAIRPADAVAHGLRTVGDAARLVRETFTFLLEREPKESILPRFDLDVVRRYFPEFEREIRGRLAP